MTLEPAKCPSCGANIEVNKDLEKTICQYCGTTVLIKDAIQKYQVELTGSVQVDGLKSDKKKFEEVEKYFKLKEYGNAKRTLDQIIANDEFNIEANCKWIYAVIKYFDITEETFDKVDILAENREMWEYVRYIITRFERISVIDEDNERDIYLKDLYNILDVMKKYMQEEDETKAKREELAKNLSDAIEKNFKYSRNRVKNSINNLSILRKIVFNLASLDNSFGKVPLKRKLTNYMLDFSKIERLIFEVIPSLDNCQ